MKDCVAVCPPPAASLMTRPAVALEAGPYLVLQWAPLLLEEGEEEEEKEEEEK